MATDHDDIAQVVSDLDLAKASVYRRSDKNAQDRSSTESVMLEYLAQASLDDDDIFILAQATSPFTREADFAAAMTMYVEQGHDSLLSVVRDKRFFWTEEGQPINYDPMHRPRRQDFDGQLMENGAFYITRVGDLKRSKNRLSGKIGLYEMAAHTAVELDEPEDWIIAEQLFENLKKKGL